MSMESFFDALQRFNDWDAELIKVLVEEGYYKQDDAVELVESGNFYTIAGDSFEDVGIHLVDDGHYDDVPDRIAFYINYKAIGRDYCLNHNYVHIEIDYEGYYIFFN